MIFQACFLFHLLGLWN